jgi:DNA-binding NarL/FixJ family response regulator
VADPTPRQREIARLIATEGLTIKEAAVRVGASPVTVKRLLYGQWSSPGLYERIGARSGLDVVRWYWAEGGRDVCERQAE